ncbi:DUF7159 family protein [Mycolicibacterium thermoresistibile]
MNFVLGLSVTSAGARAVLVEGTAGDGATIDQFTSVTADGLVRALCEDATFGAVLADNVATIGVTCSHDAGAAAGLVVDDLLARGYPNVVAVPELDAAEALATGLADLAGYRDIAVCLVEPDDALIAVVDGGGGVVLDGVDRMTAAAAEDVADRLIATLHPADAPEAVFVVGSAADVDDVATALQGVLDVPVISAQDGDLALARGAALAAARTADTPPARPPLRLTSVGALSSVLVAASLTFVVSLSVALGLRWAPQSAPEHRDTTHTAKEARQVAEVPAAPRPVPAPPEAPPPAPEAPPPPEAPEMLPPEDVAEAPAPVREVAAAQPWRAPAPAAPPPPAPPPAASPPPPPPAAPPLPPPPAYVPPAPAPVYTPPEPAYVPPAPAPEYVPPAPPAYVPPPANPAPEPRLRDRIIERIPIINRFHEPQYPG